MVAGAREFLEHWATLSDAGKASEDRAAAYLSFAGYLKDSTGTPEFYSCMGQFRQRLTKVILNDVKSGSCDQEALQMFGYCLHNSNFANLFSEEEVSDAITVLCDVIGGESVGRNVCTRALWCLANQNFPEQTLSLMVPTIVSAATEVVTSRKFETSVVATEALNTFISLHQRCLEAFVGCAPTWYKAAFTLIFCKIPKLQRKALNLACVFERYLLGNHELVHWLIKELREHAASTMAKLMTEKGQDHCVILNAWGHFITLLGKTLHKHGSFLNELLKVVEVGFKHKGFVLQVAAYKAWKALITNFSLDIGIMSSPKRLKLLLMPLLASAVKDRHQQVENMRLQVWWHLISCLGNKIQDLFQQVCIPFLLFSLGMDPKMDLSQFPTFISNLTTSRPYSTSQTSESDHGAADNKSLSSASLDKENCLTADPERDQEPLRDGLGTPVAERRRYGFLLSLASSARSQSSQSSSKKRSGDRYQATPSLEMVLSGCQAVLQFVGAKDEVPGSTIKPDFLSMAYLNSSVSLDIAQLLLFFLDGVIMYANHYGSQFKDDILGLVVQRVMNAILTAAEHVLEKDGRSLLAGLLELTRCSPLQEKLSPVTRMELLYCFVSTSPHLLLSPGNTPGQALWQSLLEDFLKIKRSDFNRDTFHNCWGKLVSVATSLPPCLQNFQYLVEQVDALASSSEGATRSVLVKMWTTLAKKFAGYIKKTSDINHGSVISPDFTSSRLILKFPFQYLLTGTGERSTINSCLGTWKDAYDVINIHMSLAVKDPNLCTQLVCGDLYSVYGQNAKVDSVCLERTRLAHFDIYQNAVAVALQFIASKVNWGSLGRGEGGAKSIQALLNLLAWQLATFWDTVQKSFFPLATLTTPYTISDTLSQLYGSFPTSHIIRAATEMLAQPLATLWETLLSSEPSPSVSRPRSKQPKDLHLQVIAVWKSIMTCFQARYTSPFDSAVLSSLSPLLVVALGSGRNELLGPTLSFWASTFDQAGQLTYPEKLREVFSQVLKSSVGHQLRLPGFNKEVPSIEDSFGNNSEAMFQSTESHPQDNNPSVVLPNPSPRKGVKGSFLNQLQSPIRQAPPTTPERSPAAKSLDDILARSRTKQPASAGGGGDEGGGGRKSGSGSSAALSVRRKLSLTGEEEETYVAVAPPPKKRRLLTEHQKEKLRERSPIPVLYNALDPSQDSSLPFTIDDEPVPESPPGDDPIIIPESEVSPATPISLRRSGPQATPTSGARRSLPAEAMDTDALPEFPVPVGNSKSHSDNSNSHSRTPKPLGDIPIPIPKPSPSGGSRTRTPQASDSGSITIADSVSTHVLPVASQNRQPKDVIVVQDDTDDVDKTPPLAPPTTDAPPTVTLTPVQTSTERRQLHSQKDSDRTPPVTTTLSATRNPPKLIPHPHTPTQAPSPTHAGVPPRLLSTAAAQSPSVTTVARARTSQHIPRPSPYRHHAHSSAGVEEGRGHARPTLPDGAVRTTSVAGRQVISALISPAGGEVPAKTSQASLSEFRHSHSQLPPPYTAAPLTIAPTPSRTPHTSHTSTLLPLHHPTQPPPPRTSTLITVPPSQRYGHPPHLPTSIPTPHARQYIPAPLSGHPHITALPRTPLSPPHSQQPRPQLPPPLSHPPILPSPPSITDAVPSPVYQTLVQQPSPSLPPRSLPARHPLPLPPASLPHPRPHLSPALPRGLSPTESAFGIRRAPTNSSIFEKAIQLVHTMNPPNQLPASPQVLEYPQPSQSRQSTSRVSTPRVSTRTTPIALMAVDSDTNSGMFVVMRHDIVDTVSPTMPGGQSGIPIPVSNSSMSGRQPMAVSSTVRDPVPISVMTRSQHAAVFRPRSGVFVPHTASPAPLSPNNNPFLNSQQVASTAEAVKKHFAAAREVSLSSSRVRQSSRGGHRPTAQERRPQALPVKPVEPVMVVDLTQQGDVERVSDVTGSERSVARHSGTPHARVPPPSETGKTSDSLATEQSTATRVVRVAEPDILAPSASGSELVEDPLAGLPPEKPSRSGESGEGETPAGRGVADAEEAMDVGEVSSKVVADSVSDGGVVSTAGVERGPLSVANSKQVVHGSELAEGSEGAGPVSTSEEGGVAAAVDGDRKTGEEGETPSFLPLPQLPPLPKAPPLPDTQEVPDTLTLEKTSSTESDGSKQLDEDVPQTPRVAAKAPPPATPTQQVQGGADPSPKATPGILKHTSQFDTPSSANKGRRVQFASAPVVIQSAAGKSGSSQEEEEAFKTPRHSRGPRTPQSLFSSRRTLLMPQTPTRMIQVSKAGPAPSPASGTVVFPALSNCSSPVEQIVPALSPSSRYTHGLLQLVHARNIRTVGNISSLTEQQVQTLPIQSPKVETLRSALRSFQQQQLGTKRRNSADSEASLSKVSRVSQPASSSSEGKPLEIGEGKPLENGEGKPLETSEGKPLETGEGKPLETGEGKPLETGEGKPLETDEGKLLETSEGKPLETEEGKPLETEEGKPLETGEGTLAPESQAGESELTQSSEEQGDVITLSTPDSQLGAKEMQGAGQEEGEAATPTQAAEQLPSSMPTEPQQNESHSGSGLEPESVRIVPTGENLMDIDNPSDDDEVFEEASQAVSSEASAQDAGGDAEPGDGVLPPPITAEGVNVTGERAEGESAAMEPEQPRELLEEGGSPESPTSTVIHDHSYCSQNHSDSVPVSGEEDREVGPDPAPHSSKLSSASTDHTYCYPNSAEDIRRELDASSVAAQTAGEGPLLDEPLQGDPTQDGSGLADGADFLQNAESQELFSYDHGDVSPTLDLPSPGTASNHQPGDPVSDTATREYQTPPPDDIIDPDFAMDYTNGRLQSQSLPPASVTELASLLDFVTASLPSVEDVAGVLGSASLEEMYSVHRQLGAIAFHCMRLQQLDIGRGE